MSCIAVVYVIAVDINFNICMRARENGTCVMLARVGLRMRIISNYTEIILVILAYKRTHADIGGKFCVVLEVVP